MMPGVLHFFVAIVFGEFEETKMRADLEVRPHLVLLKF